MIRAETHRQLEQPASDLIVGIFSAGSEVDLLQCVVRLAHQLMSRSSVTVCYNPAYTPFYDARKMIRHLRHRLLLSACSSI